MNHELDYIKENPELYMRLFDQGLIWTPELAWMAVRRAVGLPIFTQSP